MQMPSPDAVTNAPTDCSPLHSGRPLGGKQSADMPVDGKPQPCLWWHTLNVNGPVTGSLV